MGKKRLNEDAIISELRGQSAFFRKPEPPSAEPLSDAEVVTQSHSPQNASISTPVAPPERPEHPSPTLSPSSTLEESVTTTPERANDRTGEREYGRTGERPNGRTGNQANNRTGERPNARTDDRRSSTRYSFEFYQDQIATLKKLSLEAQLRGEKGSMSEMVRDAVDMFIEHLRTRDSS